MNLLLFLNIFLFCTKLASAESTPRINEGASTSKQSDPLDSCVQCELQQYATRFVLLLSAEDLTGGDIVELAQSRMHELEAFHDDVTSQIIRAEFGRKSQPDMSMTMRNRRLGYFYSAINHVIVELVEKACTEHYRHQFYYLYNSVDREIQIHETISDEDDECLCSKARERSILNVPFNIPLSKQPEKKYALIMEGDRLTIDETTVYYIIPLPLISRFFKMWLSEHDEENLFFHEYFNGCVRTLYGRIRRSMIKILAVSLKKSRAFSNPSSEPALSDFSFSDETVLIQTLHDSPSWLSGNIFIGPTERGPFVPSYGRTEDQLLWAFEYDSVVMIGHDRYIQLLTLFNHLIDYVQQAPELDPFERLYLGFSIFSEMALRLNQRAITHMNGAHWEERVPTEDEAMQLPSALMRNLVVLKKYWFIKKDRRRDERSVDPDYYRYFLVDEALSYNENQQPITVTDLKNRWSEFVLTVMKVSLDAKGRNESLTWSCNLTRLYNEYLFRPMIPLANCSTCVGFDEYLYRKISNSKLWDKCNLNSDPILVTGWCASWRNIMMELNKFKSEENKPKNYRTDVSRWKPFMSDFETLISRLSMSKEEIQNGEKLEIKLIKLSKPPFDLRMKTRSSVDVAWCVVSTLVPTILTMNWQECKKQMG